MTSIKLRRPIPGPDGMVERITLGAPTRDDFADLPGEIGNYERADGGSGIAFTTNRRLLADWLERLSGLPFASLEHLSAEDAGDCIAALHALLKSHAGLRRKN